MNEYEKYKLIRARSKELTNNRVQTIMNRYEKKRKVNSQKWIENENVSNHERIFHQFRLQNSSDKGKIRDIFEITKRQNRSFGDISMARRGGEKKKLCHVSKQINEKPFAR